MMRQDPDTVTNIDQLRPALTTHRAVILVVDLVESVRLMQLDELGVVERWQAFMHHVQEELLPALGGRLVKSLGDGLLAEFNAAASAVTAAAQMHRWMDQCCAPLRDGARLGLRAGLHASDVYEARLDLLGVGVNLAARIAGLAQPGETIASVQVRDLLHDPLDADIHDLGDCHLRHIPEPVRVYRIGPPQGPDSLPSRDADPSGLLLSIAVIPFYAPLATASAHGIGDLIADGLIDRLSRSSGLRVVSRLSTAAFRDRPAALAEIAQRLQVRYVIAGSYVADGQALHIRAELADATSGQVLWSDRVSGSLAELLTIDCEPLHELADAVHRQLLEASVEKATVAPLPALSSYELFLGGVALMHRASPASFETSRRLLESLTDRHRRIALPHAWLAKWHVLRSIQGAVDDPRQAAAMALEHTARALDLEPRSALALAIEGFVHCHLRKDLDTAGVRLEQACAANPSEGFAWLFLAVTKAFQGEAQAALVHARRALTLSPMDPLRYYYESLMASCEFAAGHHADALAWGERSLKRNRQHLSTLRILIAAHAALGEEVQAVELARDVLRLRPDYTVSAYRAHSVAALYPFGQRVAEAMQAAGIPAG
jgi:adenylate cyclase